MKARILILIFSISLFACASSDEENLLLQLVNEARSSGCDCGGDYCPPTTPVSWDTTLELVAHDHSLDMDKNKFLNHTGSNGSNPGQRMNRRGYDWRTYGENIASGQKTEEDVIAAWLKSPGHCKNIMNPAFKDMGISRVGNYWTQVFGAKR
jgi:uncharacterized protein YkwD